jgi:hypothetical protein
MASIFAAKVNFIEAVAVKILCDRNAAAALGTMTSKKGKPDLWPGL